MSRSEQEKRWSARFEAAGEEYVFGTSPNRFLVRHAGHFASATTALSVADGEGRNAVWLAEQGIRVCATEFSPIALEKAKKLAAGRHVEVDFVLADAIEWNYPEAAFDLVAGIFVQFATPAERPLLFAGMKRALTPGGVLVLLGYTPKQLDYRTGGPSLVEHMYTEPMLREAFGDMEILHLEEFEDELDEGAGHRGTSALVGLVARKPG